MLAMVAGIASADMDSGQLNISGLVVDNTCEVAHENEGFIPTVTRHSMANP